MGILIKVLSIDAWVPVFKDFPYTRKGLIALLGIPLGSAAILAALLYVPITSLQQLGEFEYGVDSLLVTLEGFIQDGLMGQGYFGDVNVEIFMGIFMLVVGVSVAYGIYMGWKAPNSTIRLFYFAASFMWVLLILALVTQFYLLGTKYLVHRTALLFIPLSGIPVFMFLHELEASIPKLSFSLGIIMILFSFVHFTRTANLIGTREWYYDAQTREMVEYIDSKVPEGQTIKLGVYWIFSHATMFYQQTRNLTSFEPIIYEKSLRSDTTYYDYYYVEPGQGNQLPDYVLEKRFGYVGILYRRKGIGESPAAPTPTP